MREYKGEWFLANKQETKIPGVLIINEEGSEISLELFSKKELSSVFNDQLVLGICGIDKITVLQCRAKSYKVISSNHYISTYSPNFIFIGCHFNSEEEIKFKSIALNLTYLGQWLEPKKNNFFKLDFKNDNSVIAQYIPRADVEIKLKENCSLTFNESCLTKGGLEDELGMKVQHYAIFTFTQHQSFDTFLDLTVRLQHLLMLFIGKPISIVERFGFSEKTIEANQINYLRIEDNPIEIFNYSNLNSPVEKKFIHFNEILVSTLNFSKDEIKQFIAKWFEEYEKFEPVYDIFFHAIIPFWKGGSFTITNVSYNNAFLNIVQAIESYHRIRTDDSSKDNTEFNKRKQEIIANGKCLSSEDKKWIQDNAKPIGGKEFTLKERIKELITDKNIFDNLFNNETDVAKQLVEWRDKLTHVNHKKSTDIEIRDWFDKAQIILIVTIFKNLGIDDEKIKQIINYGEPFKYFK